MIYNIVKKKNLDFVVAYTSGRASECKRSKPCKVYTMNDLSFKTIRIKEKCGSRSI